MGNTEYVAEYVASTELLQFVSALFLSAFRNDVHIQILYIRFIFKTFVLTLAKALSQSLT